MPNIRESIDEMIEESYLLGLSESEIKADLDRFVEVCGRVILENIDDRKQMQVLAEKLARARALDLIEDNNEGEEEEPISVEGTVKSSRQKFAQKVARNKRLILRTIRDCDPKLEHLIEQQRFPDRSKSKLAQALPIKMASRSRVKDLLMKTCYAVTLLLVLLLVYLVLLQNI